MPPLRDLVCRHAVAPLGLRPHHRTRTRRCPRDPSGQAEQDHRLRTEHVRKHCKSACSPYHEKTASQEPYGCGDQGNSSPCMFQVYDPKRMLVRWAVLDEIRLARCKAMARRREPPRRGPGSWRPRRLRAVGAVSQYACSERQTPPGSQRPSSRAAVLTPSPIRSPSLSSTPSPRWTPIRNSMRLSGATPALRSTIALWTSMAQFTASTTLRNSRMLPSPVRLTMRP